MKKTFEVTDEERILLINALANERDQLMQDHSESLQTVHHDATLDRLEALLRLIRRLGDM
jgi:hypothetical protein